MLYDVELHIARELSRDGSLESRLRKYGLDSVEGGQAKVFGLACDWDCVEFPSHDVAVAKLIFEPDRFQRWLKERFADFNAWLWRLLDDVDAACAYVPVSSDYRYQADGVDVSTKRVLDSLPSLFQSGTVEVLHPLMILAERLPNDLARRLANVPWHYREYRAASGCLLAIANTAPHAFEIMEPATRYREYLSQLAGV